jgi:transcription elongation factor GreA
MEKTMTAGDGRVILGTSVTLRLEPGDRTVSYRLVEEKEADIPAGKLSVSSPLARALLGREEDELVTVEAPGGERTYRILKISQSDRSGQEMPAGPET